MNQTELNKYKAMLGGQKQAELSLGLRNRGRHRDRKDPGRNR